MNHFALIWSFATREFKSTYSASFLGTGWAILNPAITIGVFWVIFSLGFKLNPVQEVPFIVWLLAGFAPWWLFAEIVTKSTTSVVENGQLIKKTVFPAATLPLAKIVVALFNHMIVLLCLAVLMYFNGIKFHVANIQILYYLGSLLLFSLGVSLCTSAFNVVSRDTSQAVGSILQIGFWATPIFWTLSLLPDNAQKYFTYNPMYYIVEGYRSSIITHQVFWEDTSTAPWFWLASGITLVLGYNVFRKLRPHFADLL